MPTPREYCVFDLLIKILGDDQHQEDMTMIKFAEMLEVAIEEQDKMKVMMVLDDILEYAIEETDGDLIQRTLETIYMMKEEETEMLNNNNVDLSLKGINKEEEAMNTFNGEIKDLETGQIERVVLIDKGDSYLAKPYMLESSEDGKVSHRYYRPYVLSKELEGFEYEIYLQEEEETTIKMNLQLFANKEEEESMMLEQIERFKDIAKQIEEMDEAGEDVYVGGVKVSWESVKQYIYEVDEDELEFLAYSDNPMVPAELEAYAIYLLEAEKAWDNELTMQNDYFNSKKHLSMDLQFFAKKSEEEVKMKKMSKRNSKKVVYVVALILITVFAKEWFNLIDGFIPKSSMDGAEIFLVAPIWVSSYLFLSIQSFRWIGGFLITLAINLKELRN